MAQAEKESKAINYPIDVDVIADMKALAAKKRITLAECWEEAAKCFIKADIENPAESEKVA